MIWCPITFHVQHIWDHKLRPVQLLMFEKLQLLGANLFTGSDPDISSVTLNTLKPSLDASLEVFAKVIMDPAFPEKELSVLGSI